MTSLRYPLPTALERGEVRYWCPCGHLASTPHCGHPAATPFTARRREIVIFCGCGLTSTPPRCDGHSHRQKVSGTS